MMSQRQTRILCWDGIFQIKSHVTLKLASSSFLINSMAYLIEKPLLLAPIQYLKSPTVSSSINLWEAIILRIFREKRCPKLSYFQSLSFPHISSTKAPSIYVGMAPSVASRSGVLAGGPTMVPKKRVSSIAYVHH